MNSRPARTYDLNFRRIVDFEVQIEEDMVRIPGLTWILPAEILESGRLGVVEEGLVLR